MADILDWEPAGGWDSIDETSLPVLRFAKAAHFVMIAQRLRFMRLNAEYSSALTTVARLRRELVASTTPAPQALSRARVSSIRD